MDESINVLTSYSHGSKMMFISIKRFDPSGELIAEGSHSWYSTTPNDQVVLEENLLDLMEQLY